MTELEKKQDKLIEHLKCAFEYQFEDLLVEFHKKRKELESEIATLKQQQEELMDDIEVMRKYGVTEKDVQDYLKQGEKADEEKPICKHCGLSEFE